MMKDQGAVESFTLEETIRHLSNMYNPNPDKNINNPIAASNSYFKGLFGSGQGPVHLLSVIVQSNELNLQIASAEMLKNQLRSDIRVFSTFSKDELITLQQGIIQTLMNAQLCSKVQKSVILSLREIYSSSHCKIDP